jgi:hypothetical protein
MLKNSFEKIPPEVASCFWSYDPNRLDLQRDRKEIVTQVFNYGGWEAVKWVRKIYSDEELRGVLSHPARGRWFKKTLHFWLQELNVSLPSERFQRAIFDLAPKDTRHAARA